MSRNRKTSKGRQRTTAAEEEVGAETAWGKAKKEIKGWGSNGALKAKMRAAVCT